MKIPTISELLDSPQLKPWVDKASRNVMVTSVKTFVTKMSSDLQSRAAEMQTPSVSEWAERIARWIAGRAAAAPHAEINATGVLFPDFVVTPLADDALHALSAALRDYVVDRSSPGAASPGERVIGDLVRQLTAAESCLVTANHHGAVLLTLAAACGERPLLVARGHVGELSPGVTLPQSARSAGIALRECGIVERAGIEDFQEAIAGAGAVLYVAAAPASSAPTLEELAALARRHQIPLIVELGLGGIVDASRYGLSGILSASHAIERGADIVIVSGDRLLGGPACGMLMGREAALSALRKHNLMRPLAATPTTLLPLAATLQLHQDIETAERAIPILSLLSTSSENLKHRADRLAAQLVSLPGVASASAVEGPASLTARATPGQLLPGWEVVVAPRDESASVFHTRLAAATLPVAARVSEGMVHLNLRTVLPRHDMHVVDAFEGLTSQESTAATSASEATAASEN